MNFSVMPERSIRIQEMLDAAIVAEFGPHETRSPSALAATAAALIFELTSLIAVSAASVEDADRLIDAWADVTKQQIRAFGVGHSH